MDTLPDKKKTKRPSKGKRTHTRRMKQEARKASVPGNEPKKKARPAA
jgi:hypothetical protein